ncbi:MAG: DEAD/DEAH box helicase [Betaproteobacteria bacterium]|nr:DEAD/DEAH box helicase [Betaproteobacteria bacterium]
MTANTATAPQSTAATFDALELLPELLRAVAEQGYTEPTPIQRQAIPAVLARRDIMGSAQTGTGKTASFALPILQLLAPHASTSPSPARHPVRALVLTPTRELAVQVFESFRGYGKHVPLRTTVVYGGVDMNPQIRALHGGVEIVVATPGRLLDHVRSRTANLSRVEILVLDEADRMLDMGFLPDIKRILATIPAQRQNLLFSATFSDEIRKLADELLNRPILIAVAPRNTAAESVTHQAYAVGGEDKRRALAHLVKSRELRQVLVFTRTRLGANRLARGLERDGIDATAIHSNRTQAEREKALADFKTGAVRVLVATDVASRGIDIEELPIVVNYELPYSPEDYLHRIGRTGRAGSSGEAISLVEPEEYKLLADIERLLKRDIPREALEFGGAASAPGVRSEPRAHARERHGRDPRSENRVSAARGHRPAPAAKAVAEDGFDFSKPYEPANDATAASKPAAEVQPGRRRRPSRETAVLLGGSRSK